jgi:RsiW-degrading membrane proteinase PrsW (M82 family)
LASARTELDQTELNLAHIFDQVDVYERFTVIFVIAALIVVPVVGKWLSMQGDEEQGGVVIATFLVGLTALGTAIVLIAAAMGPHPA